MKILQTYTPWILAATVLLFVYSLFGRIIHVDDGILAEPAYWLTQVGHLKSEALRGWQHAEDKFLFSHKLFLYIGALFIKIFGWSIYSVKAVSLVYFVGLLYIWKKIFKFHQISKEVYLFFALILLTYGQIYELSFVFRPEVALAFYASCVYYLLQLYLTDSRGAWLVGAGILSCFAIGHHLNAVIIPGGACILLLANKRFIPMLAYGVLSSFGFLFLLLGVESYADIQLLIMQFKFQQDIGGEHFSALRYVFNIFNEHMRYFHSPSEIGFSLLLLAAVIANYKNLKKDYKNLIIYTLAAAFFLALLAHGKTSKYLTILIPLYVFMIAISFKELATKKNMVAVSVVVLYFVGQWIHNNRITFPKDHYYNSLSAFESKMEPGKNVLGTIYGVFWANPKFRYQAFMSYQWLAAHNQFEFTPAALSVALDHHAIDYVIFDQEFWNRFKMNDTALSKFELVEKRPGNLYLFKRTLP